MKSLLPSFNPFSFLISKDPGEILSQRFTRLNRRHPGFYAVSYGYLDKESVKESEDFLRTLGSSQARRANLAKALAAKLDEGQGNYSEIGFDTKAKHFTLTPNFHFAFGHREVDRIFSQILSTLNCIIRTAVSVVEKKSTGGSSNDVRFNRLQQRQLQVVRELINFVAEVARQSSSVAGRYRVLASLAKIYDDEIHIGLNNPKPNYFQAEFAPKIEELIKELDNPSVRERNVFDYGRIPIVAEAERRIEDRNRNWHETTSFLERQPGNFRANSSRANRSGPTYIPIPDSNSPVPEAFAATLSKTRLADIYHELCLYGSEEREKLNSQIEHYRDLTDEQLSLLRQKWIITKNDFLRPKSDHDILFAKARPQLTPLQFLAAEAIFGTFPGEFTPDFTKLELN